MTVFIDVTSRCLHTYCIGMQVPSPTYQFTAAGSKYDSISQAMDSDTVILSISDATCTFTKQKHVLRSHDHLQRNQIHFYKNQT